MTLFFFVVGLEIKRESVDSDLTKPSVIALPLFAASGGMLVPAALYLALVRHGAAVSGWGVVVATDIAFVVGCLALAGNRVPKRLRTFMLSLAIVDDIGAIVVIAVGYSHHGNSIALLVAGVGLAFIVALRWLGVRTMLAYWVLGLAIWAAIHQSGVHPTVTGIVLGLLTPAVPWVTSGAHSSGGSTSEVRFALSVHLRRL